jgi:hypothetical protein
MKFAHGLVDQDLANLFDFFRGGMNQACSGDIVDLPVHAAGETALPEELA